MSLRESARALKRRVRARPPFDVQSRAVVTLADILAAQERLRGRVLLSPCAEAHGLSERTGGRVALKLENLQRTGSFKERGACNKLSLLTAEERARGVVASSAGNHAQGVAMHAHLLGITATIVMPTTTPFVKVDNTRKWGATVVLKGESYAEAFAEAQCIRLAEGRVFVHPFDDADVIAGQGTLGLEIVEQRPDVELVVVCLGGGGLAAGVLTAIRAKAPRARVVGVQTAAMPSMQRSLAAGAPVSVPPARTLAEGIAVSTPGTLTFEALYKVIDDVVTVTEEEIAAAILFLLEREKTVAEGAGAAAAAALLAGKVDARGKSVVATVSGGNIDVNMLARVIERGLVSSGRLLRLTVSLPDAPGALARLAALLGDEGANILEIVHQRAFAETSWPEVSVDIVLELRGADHAGRVRGRLASESYRFH